MSAAASAAASATAAPAGTVPAAEDEEMQHILDMALALGAAEADAEDDDSDASSSTMSFTSIQETINQLNALLESMTTVAEAIEDELTTLQPPLEGLMLDQFGEAAFLASSPFRTASFAVKRAGITGLEPGRRYTYGQICGALRDHLHAAGAIDAEGTVVLNDDLRLLFEVQDRSMPYLALLGKLTNVLV
jgi:hypothetical protein